MTERTRTYTWHDPIGVLEAIRAEGLAPLEYFRRMVSGDLPPPAIAETLGYRLVEAEPGRTSFEVVPQAFHYNPIGTVHAGLALTLLDSAMGCALASTLEASARWTTLEVKANFTRAITVDTGPLRCTGTLVHPGKTVATAEARLEDSAGRLYAHGTCTLLLLA